MDRGTRSPAKVQTQRLQTSSLPAHQVYSTFSFLPAGPPSTLPSPENSSSASLIQLSPPPPQPTRRIHALLSLSALLLSLAGHPPAPRALSRPLCLRSTWCPWKRILPPRPPPSPPPTPGLTREPRPRGPRFPPARSPRSDSCLAGSREEVPSWPQQASSPSRLGRAAAA